MIVQKSLNEMLKTALIFYFYLIKHLKALGFKLNHYNPCIVNRIINSKQQALLCHIDDMKMPHMDPVQNTLSIIYLNKIYGKEIIVT